MADPGSAFGKLQRDEEGHLIAWHPLWDHLTDVAACFEALCACHAVRRALEQTAGRPLVARDIDRLAVLVFLHDLGKANSGFQAKRWSKGGLPRGWPLPAGHGREVLKLFDEEALAPLIDLLPVAELCAWGEAVEPLLRASISHHGRPILDAPGDWNTAIWKPVTTADGSLAYDPALVLARISSGARTGYPDAFVVNGEPLPESPAFGHLFAGLVQLADWLGSATAFFPFSTPGEDRPSTAPTYAHRAVATLGLDAEGYRVGLNTQAASFHQVFGNPPYPIQAAMAQEGLGSLVVLESETGSGKTEAALWRFVHLFQSGAVDSLYFALPTRVSASQVYERILLAVSHLWPTDPPLVVRALPGYASADGQEPRVLPDFQVLWPDKPEDVVAHRRWAAESPKRFLAAPLAVGTIDQALFAALQVRHAHLRHALLARSLLVVDEVHASDPYMTLLLERLLRAHLGCGGHALLLSATLGSSARTRYLGLDQDTQPATPCFQTACAAPYPVVSDGAIMHAMPSTTHPKTVSWTLLEHIDDPEKIAGLAVKAAAEGAKILIVRNTVPAALAVFRELEHQAPDRSWLFNVGGVATLHHSRFSRQDRPLLDAAIQDQLGKNRPRGPRIVVGTQTLEQSLDLDADVLITDLCPMDVLLQRIGRLHRHPRPSTERPPTFRSPQAWVLAPPGQDLAPLLKTSRHGLGPFRDGDGIYPDLRIVEATRRLVVARPTVSIPADNRGLVEGATHPDRLLEIETLGDAWRLLGQRIEGLTGAKRTLAHLHSLEIDKPFDTQQDFPTDLDIATRLGLRDRLLTFEPAPPGPFGQALRQLPIRHFLIPSSVPLDAVPTEVTIQDGIILFKLETVRFSYSHVGLERIEG